MVEKGMRVILSPALLQRPVAGVRAPSKDLPIARQVDLLKLQEDAWKFAGTVGRAIMTSILLSLADNGGIPTKNVELDIRIK